MIDLPFEGRKVEGSRKYRGRERVPKVGSRREETITEPINSRIGLIDLCAFWHVAKRRSHQAIQRIYISVHQQKLEIKDFIKHLSTQIENKNNHFHSCIDLKRKIQMQSSFIRKKKKKKKLKIKCRKKYLHLLKT